MLCLANTTAPKRMERDMVADSVKKESCRWMLFQDAEKYELDRTKSQDAKGA